MLQLSSVLPAGHWLVCISVKIDTGNWGGPPSGRVNNGRGYVVLALEYDGNIRHSQTSYIRHGSDGTQLPAAIITQLQGSLSVTGGVVSDGVKPIQAMVYYGIQGIPSNLGSQPNNGSIRRAHIHAYRQFPQ